MRVPRSAWVILRLRWRAGLWLRLRRSVQVRRGIGNSLIGAHDDACARGARGGLSSRLSHYRSPPDDGA